MQLHDATDLQPRGNPLYPMPTIRLSSLTMHAPTWVEGSLDRIDERKAMAMKYSSQQITLSVLFDTFDGFAGLTLTVLTSWIPIVSSISSFPLHELSLMIADGSTAGAVIDIDETAVVMVATSNESR